MTDRIEPALTAEEWARIIDGRFDPVIEFDSLDSAEAIAFLNHELPDSDPRKITREIVEQLRSTRGEYLDFSAFGDALESYLPPE